MSKYIVDTQFSTGPKDALVTVDVCKVSKASALNGDGKTSAPKPNQGDVKPSAAPPEPAAVPWAGTPKEETIVPVGAEPKTAGGGSATANQGKAATKPTSGPGKTNVPPASSGSTPAGGGSTPATKSIAPVAEPKIKPARQSSLGGSTGSGANVASATGTGVKAPVPVKPPTEDGKDAGFLDGINKSLDDALTAQEIRLKQPPEKCPDKNTKGGPDDPTLFDKLGSLVGGFTKEMENMLKPSKCNGSLMDALGDLTDTSPITAVSVFMGDTTKLLNSCDLKSVKGMVGFMNGLCGNVKMLDLGALNGLLKAILGFATRCNIVGILKNLKHCGAGGVGVPKLPDMSRLLPSKKSRPALPTPGAPEIPEADVPMIPSPRPEPPQTQARLTFTMKDIEPALLATFPQAIAASNYELAMDIIEEVGVPRCKALLPNTVVEIFRTFQPHPETPKNEWPLVLEDAVAVARVFSPTFEFCQRDGKTVRDLSVFLTASKTALTLFSHTDEFWEHALVGQLYVETDVHYVALAALPKVKF